MHAWRRHQLVWLDDDGWRGVLASWTEAPQHDAQALECLRHWAGQRWPLVVTRQRADPACAGAAAPLALGLPAPARWERRRIAIDVPLRAVLRQGEFAAASEVGPTLPASARAAWLTLCAGLASLGVTARVYGSHGWQQLTGLTYVHPQSDIDLLLPVQAAPQADRVCALLLRGAPHMPRTDGELAFLNGAAVAWREWVQWRSGQVRQVLVKRIEGSTLEDPAQWLACA